MMLEIGEIYQCDEAEKSFAPESIPRFELIEGRPLSLHLLAISPILRRPKTFRIELSDT